MREDELRDELRSVPVPDGSRQRALNATAACLPVRKRRRWRVPLGAGLVLLVGFSLTTAGQATVDWVAETVDLKETDATTWAEQRAGEELLGEGTTPEGGRYRVGAFFTDGGICIDLSYPVGELDAADVDGDGQAACPGEVDQAPGAGVSPFGLTNRRAGGVVGLGVTSPDVDAARVSFELADGATGEGVADVYPVSGTTRSQDGTTKPIEPSAAIVLFLPPGAGDIENGSTAAIELLDESGQPIATEPLTWVAVPLGFGEQPAGEVMVAVCDGRSFAARICADAESGELGRVEQSYAKPLPEDLVQALGVRGYSFTVASDEDRTIAGSTFDPFEVGSRFRLPGTNSLSYLSLGRVSGPGFDSELVYVVHNFRIEGRRGTSSTSSDVGESANPPDSLSPPAKTRFFDAATLERVGVVHYP